MAAPGWSGTHGNSNDTPFPGQLGCCLGEPFPHHREASLFPQEKAMAPHSSTLAWKIPWMQEPGGLQSMGSLGVGHD